MKIRGLGQQSIADKPIRMQELEEVIERYADFEILSSEMIHALISRKEEVACMPQTM